MTFSETEPESQDLKEIATQRWKAVEAFLSLPIGLEARLGAKLVAAMNAQTRVCMPSEVRLIAELGCSRRGLQQAKASLRQQGLIDWQTPVGPRGGAMYQFNFEALELLHTENKTKGNEAVAEQRENNLTSPYYTARRVFKAKANPSDNPVKARFETHQGAFSDIPKRIFAQSIAYPSAQDIALNLTHRTLPLNHADHFAIGGDEDSPTNDDVEKEVRKIDDEPKTHRPADSEPTLKKKRCRFPRLIEHFASDEITENLILNLDLRIQDEADKLRATQGTQVAAQFLAKYGIPLKHSEQKQ